MSLKKDAWNGLARETNFGDRGWGIYWELLTASIILPLTLPVEIHQNTNILDRGLPGGALAHPRHEQLLYQ
jgi:hypothetical protein